jgi:cytochrome P450
MVTTVDPQGAPALDEQLQRILASDPEAMAHPEPVWRRLREEAPVHRLGPVVLVSAYAQARDVLRDQRRFSNRYFVSGSRAQAIKASLSGDQLRAYEDVGEFESMYMSRSDDEPHDRRRGSAARVFTPRRIAEMRSSVERYTDEMLEQMAGEDVTDIVSRLSYRLPLMLICDMLGVPESQRDQIHEWSGQIGRNRGGDDPEALMIANRAMQEFRHYVEDILVPLRAKSGGSDLLTALLAAEESARLTPIELTAMFVVLLFAGHETTTNLISIGVLELLRNRDQWELLCRDPSLAPRATEELLRWVTPVQFQWRATREDLEIDGVPVESGVTVAAVLAAANRDPAVFADPEHLNILRSDAKQHLALGLGPHFCLGNALARLEGSIVFERLARRFPELELADDSPGWRGNAMMRGLGELKVKLGTRRAVA